MQLIQENGVPNYGRFNQLPSTFNIESYQHHLIEHPLRRKLRYKKFSFIGIQHQQYSLGLAIADLAWIGHGFYYCYDRDTQNHVDYHALQPFGIQTQVQELTNKGQFNCFKHAQIEIYAKQTNKFRKVDIRKNNETLAEFKILAQADTQPLYMCSPTGIRGWTFTHKSMCLPVQGYFMAEGQKVTFDESSLASLDDSCGFLRPETEWFWLSCQTILNGRKIGINLASGVNESVGNENCLWIDGQIFALNDVIFTALNSHAWRVYSLDGKVDLTVKNGWRRYEKMNVGFAASQFSQWLSEIKGVVGIGEQQIYIEQANAIFEQHYAKW